MRINHKGGLGGRRERNKKKKEKSRRDDGGICSATEREKEKGHARIHKHTYRDVNSEFQAEGIGRAFGDDDCEPPGLLQESLGPFGPEVSPECSPPPKSVPRKRGGSPGSGVSKKCPERVPGVSGTEAPVAGRGVGKTIKGREPT